MKKKLLLVFLILAYYQLSVTNCHAQYTKLLDFDGVNGRHPINSTFVSVGNSLYGLTYQGGAYNKGVIFKIDTNGSNYFKMHDFSGVGTDGSNPYGSLLYDGAYLYGMTKEGGTTNAGSIFKIKADGTDFSNVFNFSGWNGSDPTGSLVSDGAAFYGMTEFGGAPGSKGVLFKIENDGTYTKLLDFTGSNGAYPRGTLFYDGTFLYGMTRSGGVYDKGVIFKIKPSGADYEKMFDFSGAADGEAPYASFISDGTFLYGMTSIGAADNAGAIFKISLDGSNQYTNIYEFQDYPDGRRPYGNLIYRAGFLYGVASAGGDNDRGSIFKIRPDGTQYAKIFSSTVASGYTPFGTFFSDATYFYGMNFYGGTNDLGTVFKYKYCTTVASSQSVTVCAGQSVTVGVHTYTATNTYVDTLTAISGCDSIVTTTLTVTADIPAPVSITGITTICQGNATTLTAVGAVSYAWTSGPTTDAFVVSPTATKGYTVTGTDANSCITIATETVTVNSLPAISITGITTICNGANTTLTGAGALSYVWDSGSTTDAIIVSPTTSTGYTVTGTDANSCVNTATAIVTVNSLPLVTANPTASMVCAGTSVTLTGSGAVSYAWTTGETTAAVTVSPTTGTVYTVTGTDANSCSSFATATVTINPLPPVSITGITTICNGANTTLTGAGAVSYVWDSGSTTDAITVSPATGTGYTVTGTDANSCITTATATVTVNSLPAVSIAGVTTICNGAATTLAGTGAVSYAWSTGPTTTAIAITPTTSTGYTVTGTDANSCMNTAAATVTVNSLPLVTANPTASTVCAGTPVTLTGSGAAMYVWTTGGTIAAVTVSPTTSTGYTVTGTDANSCSSFATTTITVNSLPVIFITGSTTICKGASTTLIGTGAVSYSWSSGLTTTAITVMPTTSRGYTLTGTDVNSCMNAVTTTVTVNSLPLVTANPTTSTVCAGTSVTLTGSGAVSYTWTTGGTTTSVKISPTTSTGYTVTGTDANSCSSFATAIVTVNPLPSISIAGSTTICKGTSATLTGSGALSYLWSTGPTATAITVTPTTSTGYTVTGTNANNCSNFATAIITVNPLPSISIAGLTTICKGTSTTLTGSGALSYLWSTGPATTAITVTPTISTGYTVTGMDVNGCSGTATKIVTVNPMPDVTTGLNGVVITANQHGAAYQWLNCNTGHSPISGATNQTYTATANGSYAVKITLAACSNVSSCVALNVVAVDEKINRDLFIVYPNPSAGIFTINTEEKVHELNIYNLLGEKIISQTIQNEKEEINLRNQPDGIYFLELRTGQGTAVKKIIVRH